MATAFTAFQRLDFATQMFPGTEDGPKRDSGQPTPLKSILSLPIDVLFCIFLFLSAKEIVRFGQTCRSIHETTELRSVWVEQSSNLRTQFPSEDVDSISTPELKRRAIREAVLQAQWGDNSTEVRNTGKVVYHREIVAVRIIPGGDYLVILCADGVLEIRPILPSGVLDCEQGPMISHYERRITDLMPHFWDCTLLPSSETAGELLVELKEFDDPNPSNIQVYFYRLNPTSLDFGASLHLTVHNARKIHHWARHGSTFGYTFTKNNVPKFYLSYFDADTVSTERVLLREAVFELLDFGEYDCLKDPPSTLVMISSCRALVTGGANCICVYDLPKDCPLSTYVDNSPSVPIHPVWKWKGYGRLYFQYRCSPIFYESNTSVVPKVYLYGESNRMHCITLSHSADAVTEHRQIRIQHNAELQMGSKRAMWCENKGKTTRVVTLTLSESMPTGSFLLPCNTELTDCWDEISFDEVSGRICFFGEEDSGKFSITSISGIVDLPQ